jgi:multidrug efflux pump subunit AcrA (membrane-fusion protein)
LRAGAFVEAHIWNGPEREALVVPASAILEEKGVDVVYVMVGGERFERRMVRLGARDRDKVEILSGLEPGARVVTDGAYYVKLAGTSTGSVGHGHAH